MRQNKTRRIEWIPHHCDDNSHRLNNLAESVKESNNTVSASFSDFIDWLGIPQSHYLAKICAGYCQESQKADI
jgi:hypothetical protein